MTSDGLRKKRLVNELPLVVPGDTQRNSPLDRTRMLGPEHGFSNLINVIKSRSPRSTSASAIEPHQRFRAVCGQTNGRIYGFSAGIPTGTTSCDTRSKSESG